MPKFTILIPHGKEYVQVVLRNPVTRDLTADLLPEIKRLGKRLVRPRFLIDARGAPDVRGPIGDYEVFGPSKLFGLLGAKIAVITDVDDRSHDFTNTVANNAGYVHRVFTEEQEAINWLEHP